jgi:tetratricopeptide (TPR) repeat protein
MRQANAEMERGAPIAAVLKSLRASRAGQLRFDFRVDAEPAKIIRLRPSAPTPDTEGVLVDRDAAEDYFALAASLDDGDPARQEAASRAYRRALEANPFLVPALINLANIHYARENLVEAEALYSRAAALDADLFEAHFNLGNVYHDLGRLQDARCAYEEAVRLNPGYPDAHFYLAVTFEKMGLSSHAKPHWRQYRELAPNGEWAELAREFSE